MQRLSYMGMASIRLARARDKNDKIYGKNIMVAFVFVQDLRVIHPSGVEKSKDVRAIIVLSRMNHFEDSHRTDDEHNIILWNKFEVIAVVRSLSFELEKIP